ncbi:MAG TPA: hypothetical protein VN933_10660 [Candidatus Eremiobacteraceae bacterium]|jgi:hypothetical protein|nr:hypothetical protein [Candidatus Eremiobacteraceae bacterium]
MTAQDFKAPESVSRLQQRALIVGIIGVVACIIGYVKSPEDMLRSYLMAFMLILGLSLGSLGLLMLQHLTSGYWGIVIRRPLESATRALPLVFILFAPLFFGFRYLYGAWLNAPAPGHEGALSNFQQHYLTPGWFHIRAIIYFVVWIGLMWIFNAWSRRQDIDRDDRSLRRNLKMLAGPGIILYVFAMSFAAIDWVMSLSPHWASTIYGFLYVAGQLISSMALMICVVVLLSRAPVFAGVLKPRYLHDCGKLLLAFIMLWAYFSFSQLLIIWSGNAPEEISFYRSRLYGEWGYVSVIILIFHFFVPFFLLLSRDLKRNPATLPKIAAWMILMRLVDLFWLTRPEFTPSALPTIWDLAAALALGGLWLFVFAWQLQKMPLLPLGEPKLEDFLEPHEH